MKFELCGDSIWSAQLAKKYNLHRLELCCALSVGGLTPSPSLISACVDESDAEIHVMIRPREGNFIYSKKELNLMRNEIELAAKCHVSGVVFGCLQPNFEININQCKELVECAKSYQLQTTFHRAFDQVTNAFKQAEVLIQLQVDRILTSGGKATAEKGIDQLQQLVNHVQKQIEIMAGSGIHANNANQIAQTGVDALHFTGHSLEQHSFTEMGRQSIPNEQKIKSILDCF